MFFFPRVFVHALRGVFFYFPSFCFGQSFFRQTPGCVSHDIKILDFVLLVILDGVWYYIAIVLFFLIFPCYRTSSE